MRLRIRGPSGQSTVTLDESSTVEVLRKTIQKETSLTCFDVKYGYPPKILSLHQYAAETRLVDLDVNLAGEQLIVSSITPVTDGQSSVKANAMAKLSDKAAIASSAGLAGSLAQKSPASWPTPSTSATGDSATKSAAPLSLTRKAKGDMSDPPEVLVPDLGGTLVLRVMPDDNSCLFRAIATAYMPDLDTMTELRSIIAQTVQANPDKYTQVVLDNQKPDDYCKWIQTEDAWGGQIELDILSQHFDIEICSIDVQSLRVDKYNDQASNRCILVYSGIHYDTIALNLAGMPPDQDIKIFEPFIKDDVLPQAVRLCEKLQEKHYYTDTAGFQVKCNQCGAICIGELGAQEHAKKTGHYDFGEAG